MRTFITKAVGGLFGLLLVAVSSQALAAGPLRIGYSDWPGWVAWEVAIDKGWFKEAGVDVKFDWFDYAASMDAFSSGKLDAVGMTNGDALVTGAPGAKSVTILINDYSNGNDMVIAKPGINSIKDLKGKIAGGAAGASYGEEVDRAITDGIFSVDRDDNQGFRMRKLLAGRIDVAIIGNGTAGFELLLNLDPELKAMRSKFIVLPHPLTRDPLYLAFAKSMHMKPKLERFNQALSAFKRTAEYQKMINGEVK